MRDSHRTHHLLPAMPLSTPTITAEHQLDQDVGITDFLAERSGLAKVRIKECMNKGGVWRRRANGKWERSRKAKTMLRPGDTVRLCYDRAILDQVPPEPRLIADRTAYSVWDKPAGLLAQGTQFGDHCSLLRLAQQAFVPPRAVFLVHRLDREASGLMLIAHTAKAAAALSRLFQGQQVVKEYLVTVRGLWDRGEQGRITLPLDGKEAVSDYQLLDRDPEHGTSRLLITLHSGRLHQIRRHMAMSGFPVMGDPKYGRGNKNTTGLDLRAIHLAFDCPLGGGRQEFHLAVSSSL